MTVAGNMVVVMERVEQALLVIYFEGRTNELADEMD